MPRGKPWQVGESGNPRGRPPKARALTEILQRAGAKTLEDGGKRISGRRLVARLLWDLATSGKASFPDGKVLEITPADWFDAVKFLYQHIDGPPKQSMEVSGPDGGPIETETTVKLGDAELVNELAGIFDAARARQSRESGPGSALPLDPSCPA